MVQERKSSTRKTASEIRRNALPTVAERWRMQKKYEARTAATPRKAARSRTGLTKMYMRAQTSAAIAR